MARTFSSGDYISYGSDDPLPGGSDWSFSAMVLVPAFSGDGVIICKRDSFGPTGGKFFVNYNSSGELVAGLNGTFFASASNIGTTTWRRIGLSGTSAGVKFYIGGSEITTQGSGGSNVSQNSDWRIPSTATGSALCIGKALTENVAPFIGSIAEVGLWDRALAFDEHKQLDALYAPDTLLRGLRFYAPLIRGTENQMRPSVGTPSGTAVSAHPRIYS